MRLHLQGGLAEVGQILYFCFTFFNNSFARCFEIFFENCFYDVFVFEIDSKVIEFLFVNMYIF